MFTEGILTQVAIFNISMNKIGFCIDHDKNNDSLLPG